NGVPDVIAAPAGPGVPPVVAVFDGSDNRSVAAFFAFSPFYTGGITLGAGDVNGDGRADLVVAAGTFIKVIDGFKLNQIAPDLLLGAFFAFTPLFNGGVNVAIAFDASHDDIVASAASGPPLVRLIDGTKLNHLQPTLEIAPDALLGNFFAFTPFFKGGVRV